MSIFDDLHFILDPCYLFEQAVGAPPDKWQERLLRAATKDDLKNFLIMVSRQGGKSTTVGAIALHIALAKPGSLSLLISSSFPQARELYFRVDTMLHNLGLIDQKLDQSKMKCELKNGSRILSLPSTESSARGYTVDGALICDEAARVSDELVASLQPALAVGGGKFFALSTPYGARGWFYEAWESDNRTWHKTIVTAKDVPRISEDFLIKQQEILSPWQMKQEYFCEFVDSEDQFFSQKLIDDCVDSSIIPLF